MVVNKETCVVEQNEIEKPAQALNNSTEQTVVTDEDFEKAIKLFQQGKKNLLLSKYDEAANNIADACKKYSQKYGELNYNCADIYFHYGKALFELARVENTVLGNALSGVPEDTEPINDSRYGNPDTVPEEERNEIFDKVIDAMCEENKDEKKEEAATEPMNVDSAEKKEDKKEEPVGEPMNTEIVEMKDEERKEDTPAEPIKTVVEGKEGKEVEKASKEENGEKAEIIPENKEIENGNSEVIEKKEENEEKTEVTTEKKDNENGVSEAVEKKEENGEEENGDVEEDEEDECEDVEECEKTNDKDDEEDITNLQQSWEMFELAKVIYLKQKDLITDEEEKLKIKMRIAECMLKLGEIGIEQELFEQAINDVKESIRIQEDEIKVNERDERLLAESYYQLTLAYQFNNQFELAKESHNKATNILNLRIEKLKAKLEGNEGSDASGLEDSEKKEITNEINDLEQLLPEMLMKLEELNDQGEKVINEIRECLNGNKSESANGFDKTTPSTDSDVKDITCNIKSKRKLSSSDLNNEANDKKIKSNDNENQIN